MSISGSFIRRPVMTTLVMIGILLFGIAGYRFLPVSDLPSVDFPTLLVSASLPGASPETMSSSVATPLERQFSTIEGLDSMTSTSSLGSTQITLQFSLNRNIDAAAQDVQTAITQATPFLPQDMPQPPTYKKVNPADQPILYIALTSRTLPLWELHDYADTMMAQRISMTSGVSQVQIYGPQKYAVRVQLDPHALASRGIGIDTVEEALHNANVNLPTGTLQGTHEAFTILATGQLFKASDYRSVIVTYRDGSPVHLEELGRIVDSVENDKAAAWYMDQNGSQRAVVLAVQRQPGTNAVEVAGAVKKLLPVFQSHLPPSAEMHILYDRSESIQKSIHEVKFTMILTLVLVVMTILLFLRNFSATMIPSLALPLSIVGTFAVMYLMNYSMDNLSLMALILAIGFVVDDAIVILENIVRHMEMGEKPLQAALKGSGEISFTILSMTLSLAAVFIPVLFMGGVVGRLFREFAVTICVAILISGFVSLSLTPMLCSRFLRPPSEKKHGRLYMIIENFFNTMLKVYDRSLRLALQYRLTTMAASGVILLATGYLFATIPKGFLPNEDQGTIFTITEAQEGTSFDKMVQLQQAVADIVHEDPNVKCFYSSVGSSGAAASPNQGVLFIHLKPRPGRRLSSVQVIEELRQKLATIPGIRIFMQDPPEIRIGGRLTKSLYQFTLQSPDIEELYHYAPILEAEMQNLPILQDVTSDLQVRNPQINVVIHRDKASTLGVTARQIESALYSAYGNRWVSTIYASNDQYKVIMELDPQYQINQDALRMLYVNSSNGLPVPLYAVATLTENLGPQTINHMGQFPAVTISFNLRPGVSLSEAVTSVNELALRTLPLAINTSFQGTAQEFQSSIEGLGMLLGMAILVIYIVLGILYESFIHPITILSGLPSAGLGALLTLFIFRMDLDVYAFVGLIMLIGIVKKNAIMQIDFALEAQRDEGKNPLEAIYEGCLIRFRPIMMTTMAALMGALPIALGFGAGAEARRPLGLVMVGGLLFSQIVTLYLTPVFYTYMDTFQEKIRKIFQLSSGKEMTGQQPGEMVKVSEYH
ncbi:MAG: efflux RND transporter permease subunit [Candidatus Brocadia sp. AMX2]|uniref:Acriflavin resistance protein n=1 Tax=Candidatus Brocadia sinica JPN1 TaxID=1197129 RepID=A0ABQ0JYN0_9BACT|nr:MULTISPECIES: efflux RND transporter permease subunit [Brocadia]MBC6932337.1 AcrB/AcrD/AcrF family protein [Candidatus Brocadia sp.]MBL1169847.1 efflux RND transporter permease subunit [Candidatus Brocadia sp. AMX1]MCK6469351.1 efflux RND transporter permease subunit [Candidatus Brocadia sinica]NOG40291.1 efflux RND transporter permease subunit [Planctomycetota bacterium]MCE7866726.1 efflux RND transporter permease subunit [Candidatus Brocadia sp. AMX2]